MAKQTQLNIPDPFLNAVRRTLNAATTALHLSSSLYKSNLFAQNEPNFNEQQNTLNILLTKHLHKKTVPSPLKKTNPNEPNFKIGKIAPNTLSNKELSPKICDLALKKTNPILKNAKMQHKPLHIKALRQKTQITPTKNKPNCEAQAKIIDYAQYSDS